MRGSVVKKNDRWYVVIEDKDPATGARKRRWHSGFRTKREAQTACNELAAAMQRGDYLQDLISHAPLDDIFISNVVDSVIARMPTTPNDGAA